jgi:hypothetical protein
MVVKQADATPATPSVLDSDTVYPPQGGNGHSRVGGATPGIFKQSSSLIEHLCAE